MRHRTFLSVLAAGLLASLSCAAQTLAPATSVATQPTPAKPAATKSTAAADKSSTKVICQSQEETGSRLGGKRICMTKAQWDDQAYANRRAFEDANKPLGSPSR